MIRLLVASGAMVALLSALVVAKSREEHRLRDVIAGWEACETATTGSDLTAAAAHCPGAIAAVHRRAVQSGRCDEALAADDAFTQSAACSAPVQRLVAERDTARRERDRLTASLAEVRRGLADEIARAEARGRTQAQRTQSVQTRLDAAPRTDTGLGRCDADCLQRLGEPD